MLMRTDPFRDLDRLTQQIFGTNGTLARPSVMPMDAWRDGDTSRSSSTFPASTWTRSTLTSSATSSRSRPNARPGPATPSWSQPNGPGGSSAGS